MLLRALGMNNEEILDTFFDTSNVSLLKDGAKLELIPERLRGESALFDISDKKGNVKSVRLTLLSDDEIKCEGWMRTLIARRR